MRTHVVLALLAAVMLLMTPAEGYPAEGNAGDLLTQAQALAAEKALAFVIGNAAGEAAQTCTNAITTQALTDAERIGTGGMTAGGFLLPIIMPLIADGLNTNPPFTSINTLSPEEARCYTAAYSERGRERKVSAAWRGTWIGIGLYTGLVVLALATGPDYY